MLYHTCEIVQYIYTYMYVYCCIYIDVTALLTPSKTSFNKSMMLLSLLGPLAADPIRLTCCSKRMLSPPYPGTAIPFYSIQWLAAWPGYTVHHPSWQVLAMTRYNFAFLDSQIYHRVRSHPNKAGFFH